MGKMRLVFISDTHSLHKDLVIPPGDLIIHSGDFSGRGTLENLLEFNRWLGTLPHRHKLVLPGNHELYCEQNPGMAKLALTNGTLLIDEAITIDGVKFYLSPWSPEFYDWSFMKKRGAEIRAVWARIPEDTDVLITHGPPMGVLDLVVRVNERTRERIPTHAGCYDLMERVKIIKPKVHAFGHIHEGYGTLVRDGTTFINASICDERYRPSNLPIVIDI